MRAEILGFLDLTPQLYQRNLLLRPMLNRFAGCFELRCFQLLSTQCVAAQPAHYNCSPEASECSSSRTIHSFHSFNNTPSRYHTNCLTYFIKAYDFKNKVLEVQKSFRFLSFALCGLYLHPYNTFLEKSFLGVSKNYYCKEISVLPIHKE